MRDALVSIVIPAYNAERFIADAINSAITQQPAPHQIIVVDDGSTDQTSVIARSFPTVAVITQANAGVSTARNVGLAIATGDYVMFLDADDALLPGGLAAGVAALDADADAAIAYGGVEIVDENLQHLQWVDQAKRDLTARDIFFGANPTPSQALLRCDAVAAVNGFRKDLAYNEDQELWLRLLAQGGKIVCHGHRVASRRRHGSQATLNTVDIYRSWLELAKEHQGSADTGGIDPGTWNTINRNVKRVAGRYLPFYLRRALLARSWTNVRRAIAFYVTALPYSAMGTIDTVLKLRRRSGGG